MVAKRAAADQLDPAFLSQIDFPIVKRGFDPASVQAFAEAVGIEMSRLLEENRGLQAQIAAMKSRSNLEPVTPPAVVPVRVESVDEVEPEPVVDAVVAPPPAPAAAHVIAPSVLEMWGAETSKLMEAARQNVDIVMARADAEARGIVAKAEMESEQIRRTAIADGERQTQALRDQSASDLARAALEREQIADATRRSRLELAQLEQDKRAISFNLQSVRDAVTQALTSIDTTAAQNAALVAGRNAATADQFVPPHAQNPNTTLGKLS